MAKHRRRRRDRDRDAWLGPAHRPECICAGDHCGQNDARVSARRRPSFAAATRLAVDDTRTFQIARSIGVSVKRSRQA